MRQFLYLPLNHNFWSFSQQLRKSRDSNNGDELPYSPNNLRLQIPIWWRWYYWGSPVAWTIYGLVTSIVGDKNDNVEVPGIGEIPLKLFLKDNLGFEFDFLGVVAVAHVAWAVLFSCVFAYGIKFLNFQRR